MRIMAGKKYRRVMPMRILVVSTGFVVNMSQQEYLEYSADSLEFDGCFSSLVIIMKSQGSHRTMLLTSGTSFANSLIISSLRSLNAACNVPNSIPIPNMIQTTRHLVLFELLWAINGQNTPRNLKKK